MSDAARGTFEELLNGTAPELADIARRLREAILAVDPAAVETVRLGDNAATYGVGPKKMTEGYAYIMPMRGYVNLGFYQGASLEDARLEGTGKGLRHVKIRSLDEASNGRAVDQRTTRLVGAQIDDPCACCCGCHQRLPGSGDPNHARRTSAGCIHVVNTRPSH